MFVHLRGFPCTECHTFAITINEDDNKMEKCNIGEWFQLTRMAISIKCGITVVLCGLASEDDLTG